MPIERSSVPGDGLAPGHAAPQHSRAPRPLPLFLSLVRRAAERDPALARRALDGLAAYARAPRSTPRGNGAVIARVGGSVLRDLGGSGPPVVLVPSLINPPHILDLDEQTSLAASLVEDRRILLVDWGSAKERHDLSIGGHVAERLVPLLGALDTPPALVGYCLGGTMALAAAQLVPVERVATIAAPWHFGAYPAASRASLCDLWQRSRGACAQLGMMPMELLQSAFWSLDPERVVGKFARLAELDPASDETRRFVLLEDWANDGEPLPLPAATELMEQFFHADAPGRGEWIVGGQPISGVPPVPTLHFTATGDRIVPAASVAPGDNVAVAAGHVGMIVGRGAKAGLHGPLARWLCG